MGLLYKLATGTFRTFFRLLYSFEVHGSENLEFKGGAVIASNHSSYLDPCVIGASTKSAIHYLARESLFNPPLFAKLIRSLNAHPIRGTSNNLASIRKVVTLIQEGDKIVLFPEGVRSHDGELQPMQGGISLIVKRAECRVIPCYIHGTYEIWGRNRRFPRLSGKMACVFGKPILWSDFEDLPSREASHEVLKRVNHAISQLKEWYDSGAVGDLPSAYTHRN